MDSMIAAVKQGISTTTNLADREMKITFSLGETLLYGCFL